MRFKFVVIMFLSFFITGMYISADEYIELYPFYEGLAIARKEDGELVVINDRGMEVFSLSEMNLENSGSGFFEGLMTVSDANGKKGFVDKTGNMAIAPQYDWVKPFSEGLAMVYYSFFRHNAFEREAGYIRKNGEIAIPLIYDNATPFHDGRAFVSTEAGWFLIDHSGTILSDQVFETIPDIYIGFSEGLAAVRVNKGWGYIDTEGKWVIPPSFDRAFEFNEGLACVHYNGWNFINREGNVVLDDVAEVLPYGYHLRFVNGWAVIPEEEDIILPPGNSKYKYGYLSTDGKRIPAIFDFACNFSEEGIAVVYIGDEAGAIDQSGNWVFQLGEYDWLGVLFREGKNTAMKDGELGYINIKGEWLF